MTNELHVVFGAGAVGRAVIAALAERDVQIRVVNRSAPDDLPGAAEAVTGDVMDAAFAGRAMGGAAVAYDCLNAPYSKWPEMFPPLQRSLLAAAKKAGARLVVMENVYMYGPTHGQPMTEDLPYSATFKNGITRAAMARELLDAHRAGDVRVAIGRASDFFGPHALTSAMGERVFPAALSGKRAQVLGNPDALHTYTYIPDIGRALVTLGGREEACGRAWHIPSPETVTTREFLSRVYREAGTEIQVQTAPKWLLRLMGLFNPDVGSLVQTYYQFDEPFVLDHSAFTLAFGNVATPLDQAIAETVAWFRAQAASAQR